MGLTLEFYIGNKERIEKAFREVLLELLDDPNVIHKRADLSLHVDPSDLDLLSVEFAVRSGRETLQLRPFLTVLFDEVDRGLLLIDTAWVNYVAHVEEQSIDKIVRGWYDSMRKEHSEEDIPDPTQEAVDAVQDLVQLCKEAKKNNLNVLHGWFL